jgi:hypothetical protein
MAEFVELTYPTFNHTPMLLGVIKSGVGKGGIVGE